MTHQIQLRKMIEADLPILFEHQHDPVANHMAAFGPKNPPNRPAFEARMGRILTNELTILRTILCDGKVAGSVASFVDAVFAKREVCYWIGTEFWGKEVASHALKLLLDIVKDRPIYGRAASDNEASLRVLQKCGFELCGEDIGYSDYRGEMVAEQILALGPCLQNWSGNLKYSAVTLHYPETVSQIQEVVTKTSKLKVIGSRHSFSEIADTDAVLVCLEKLDKVIALDRERMTVTVQAGIKYGPLCTYLHDNGFALHNLASLPHISVAGAVATSTHGSGSANGSLATAVRRLEMIQADGKLIELSRDIDGDKFCGAVVGLGALGVVTSLTLSIEPTFDVSQTVFINLPFTQIERYFDEITSATYSVSLFTNWQTPTFNQVWLKRRLDRCSDVAPESTFFGAQQSPSKLHPLAEHSAENCTEQLGLPGPWFERLPHFRMEFTPSSGDELQTEYVVPRKHAVAALWVLYNLRDIIAPVIMISEIRTIAADDFWMSMSFQQESVAFHFTWKKDYEAVMSILPVIEMNLAQFVARPHWGKLFHMDADQLEVLYPKMHEFQKLAKWYDPSGKFQNQFLEKIFCTISGRL